jgi:hypothetical protein
MPPIVIGDDQIGFVLKLCRYHDGQMYIVGIMSFQSISGPPSNPRLVHTDILPASPAVGGGRYEVVLGLQVAADPVAGIAASHSTKFALGRNMPTDLGYVQYWYTHTHTPIPLSTCFHTLSTW